MFSKKNSAFTIVIVTVVFSNISNFAFSKAEAKEESKSKMSHMAMSADMKKDMANMYLKMGECMKTEKSMEDCHKETMKDCPVLKKTGKCPIMDGMDDMKMDHSQHSK